MADRSRRVLSALACCALLTACTSPGTTIRYAPPDADIRGIASELNPRQPVDVVFVHGMCPKDVRWVDASNAGLAAALGMEVVKPASAEGEPIGSSGGLLYRRELRGAAGTVRTYALLWSPVTAYVRRSLCYDTSKDTASCPAGTEHIPDRRALLNATLKNEIMDACLSEAVFAVGARGVQELGSTIEAGLDIALRDDAAPLFVVTQSLGSKLFTDAVIRMANRSCDAFQGMARTMRRTVQVFMEANQLPMLALAYNPSLRDDCPAGAPRAKSASSANDTGLGALATLRATPPPGLRMENWQLPLKVAAFSDPNDILSYTLVPVKDRFPGLELADIVVANDWSWFGVAENPLTAHVTYGEKCRVQRVIAHGTKGLSEPC